MIGVASNLLGYLLYLIITLFGAAPKLAMTGLYGVGGLIGFVGNRKYTFKYEVGSIGVGWRYMIAHCLGYLINLYI